MQQIKDYIKDVLEPSNNSKMNKIAKYMRGIAYSIDPEQRKAIGFSAEYDWEVGFNVGGFAVEYIHMIRGDLIKVLWAGEEDSVLEYVDQSEAYGGLIGWGDVEWKNQMYFDKIYEEVSK